jgi:hypothetical protein
MKSTKTKATVNLSNRLKICVFEEPDFPGLSLVKVQEKHPDGYYVFTDRFNHCSEIQPLRFLNDEDLNSVIGCFAAISESHVKSDVSCTITTTWVHD